VQTIQDTVDIPASTAAVWRVLTATQHYGAWNPLIPRLEGELRTGGRLRLTITPPGRSMTFKARVLAVEEDHLLRWRGRLGVRGVLDGEHEFRLHPLPDGGTRFTQSESFTGVLVPLVSGVLDDTRIGFAQMNQAMKRRAVTAPPPATTSAQSCRRYLLPGQRGGDPVQHDRQAGVELLAVVVAGL
jgi:hypothetical protein